MRIGVVGAGGVGGLTAGLLARAGHEVLLIARGQTLEAIRRDGLRVESPLGIFTARVEVVDAAAALSPVDAILVAVKTWQVHDAVARVGPMLGPETFVVPLQNGVEAEDECVRALGRERVIGGFCRMFSWIVAPGSVKHEGAAPQITLDRATGAGALRCVALRSALEGAGFQVIVPADFSAALWEKLIFIASFGAVGAVTRSTAGALRAVPETRRLLMRVCEEIRAVALARGIAVGENVVAQTLAHVDAFPEAATASLQRDVVAGRPSELDALVGAVVRMGNAAGLAIPTLEAIYAALLPMERVARGGG